MTTKFAIIAASAVATLAVASPAFAGAAFIVDAGYSNDTTSMAVNNTGTVNFTDVVINSVAGAFPGATEDLGALTAGSFVGVPFSQAGGAFSFDYDDFNGTAETSYQIVATSASGVLFSNIFSPSTNESGSFVDFLGTGADNDTPGVQVASAATGAVPEPGTWALMLSGFGLIGIAARRNVRTSVVYS